MQFVRTSNLFHLLDVRAIAIFVTSGNMLFLIN
jgi:hypothetical protein